jgi:hypothetical protein
LTPLSAMKTNKRRRQLRTTPYAQRARVRYTRPLTELRVGTSGAWPQNLSRPQSALPDLTRAHFR